MEKSISPIQGISSPRKITPPRIIDSAALLDGNDRIVILHEGQHYQLRLTRTGKLILTK